MPLRIAIIDNLSAAAWRLLEPSFAVDMRTGPPSATLAWLRAGEVDAALIPVAGLPQLPGVARPFGNFGIACEGAVHSVALFSQCPLDAVLTGNEALYVTDKSETSRRLLRVLCRMRHGVSPIYTSDPEAARARLLIGDDSMDTSRQELQWPVRIDLGSWWFRETGLPFVFARWVVREGVSIEARAQLGTWLAASTSLASTDAGLQTLAQRALDEGRIHKDPGFARAYYQAVRPRLTLRDLQGLRQFLALQQESAPWAKSA